ncbi:hypothetical protein F4815DRAFT_262363 [Daldinia loculata]|nr:hypothetical protein F4815DRAFT_262363 [Daldinia loculata]
MCPDGPARTGLVPTEFISACLRSCSSAPISFFPPSLPKPPRSWKHGAWMRPAQGEIKIWPCAQIFPLHRKQDRQIRTGTIPRHAYRHVHFGSYNNALIALLHGPNLTNSVFSSVSLPINTVLIVGTTLGILGTYLLCCVGTCRVVPHLIYNA